MLLASTSNKILIPGMPHWAGGGGVAGKLELSQEVVVLCHGALALVDLDVDRGMVVLLCEQGNNHGHHVLGEGGVVDEENLTGGVATLLGEAAALGGRANVGLNRLVEVVIDEAIEVEGAHKDDIVNLGLLLLCHVNEVLHDKLVEGLPPKMNVAVGGEHLENAIIHGEEGDVEGRAAKVEDEDVLRTRI